MKKTCANCYFGDCCPEHEVCEDWTALDYTQLYEEYEDSDRERIEESNITAIEQGNIGSEDY